MPDPVLPLVANGVECIDCDDVDDVTAPPPPVLTPEEERQIKVALEYRVTAYLDMINVLAEPLARQAYDNATAIVSGSVKLGLGTGTLGMSFEQAWAAREARQR